MVIIKSITLRNIMCHEALEVRFNNNVTIITGPNGSGKSAIMVALGVIFGVKRGVHQRTRRISDLVKTGQPSGKITVILKNNNFMREFFSDEIIIQRTIKPTLTTLSIMNQQNKKWSSKMLDLEKVVDHFGLYFDNPLNYLTQDMSKVFLSVSNDKKLYELFLNGTEINDMRQLHEDTKKKTDEMKESINDVNDRLVLIQEEMSSIQSHMNIINDAEGMERQLKELENEKSWSLIDFKGKEMLEKEAHDLHVTLSELVANMQAHENDLSLIVNEIIKEEDNFQREQNKQHKMEMKINKEIDTVILDKREIENDVEGIEAQIKKIQHAIDLTEIGSQINFKEEIDNLHIKIEEIKRSKTEKEIKHEKIYEENRNEEERIERENRQLIATRRMLNDAMKIKTSKLAFFGPEFDSFLNEVRKTTFKGQVIGPIASEVTLKNPKWYKPVSFVLRNILSSFAVYNQEDKVLLQQLTRKYRVKGVSIFMPSMKDTLIKYEKNSDFTTILDVLQCSNAVTNLLIILTQVERIILIEERSEAHKIIRSRPNNVDCAYIINGDVIKMVGGSLTDFAGRGDRFYFESSGARIDELNARINSLSKAPSNGVKSELLKIKKDISSLENALNRLELELKEKEIKYEAYLHTQQLPEEDIDEEQLKVNVEQRNELMNLINDKENEITALRAKLTEMTNKPVLMNEGLKSKKLNLESELCHLKETKMRLSTVYIDKTNALREKIDVIGDECNKLLLKGPMFNDPRDSVTVENEIMAIKAQIEVARNGRDREALMKRHRELKLERKQKIKLTTEYETRIDTIYNGFNRRVNRREEMKIKESERAALAFTKYTRERDYIGELIFDHENEKLNVVMNDVKNIKKKKFGSIRAGDKNTLSGGERTFAGICLLMSLWPSIFCPVKILDEFDVYMDNLNRVAAIETLIRYFKNKDSQVIMISPLEMIGMKDVDIKVLSAPRE